MLNKVDKIFIGSTFGVLFFYMLPLFGIFVMALLLVFYARIDTSIPPDSLLLFTFMYMLLIVTLSIILCHVAYFILFWTLYKKIRMVSKKMKDYFIIVVNIIAIIFYGILAWYSWYLINLDMGID